MDWLGHVLKSIYKYNLALQFTVVTLLSVGITWLCTHNLEVSQKTGYFFGVFLGNLTFWTIYIGVLELIGYEPKAWFDESWWWKLDGWQFEEEVGRVFRKNGYKVEVTKGTGDGGVDIIMYKDGLKYILQCKHYRKRLGPEAVRSLYGVKEQFKADRLIMVASSGLTPASQDFISRYSSIYKAYNLQDIIRMSQT